MIDLQIVQGADCLNYIDRPIGLIGEDEFHDNTYAINNPQLTEIVRYHTIQFDGGLRGVVRCPTTITKIKHDTTKRKVGLILDKYDDGGIYVAILGNESFNAQTDIKNFSQYLNCTAMHTYELESGSLTKQVQRDGYTEYPDVGIAGEYNTNGCSANMYLLQASPQPTPFDDMLEYTPDIDNYPFVFDRPLIGRPSGWVLTNDKDTTLNFGKGETGNFQIANRNKGNPIRYLAGNMYFAGYGICGDMSAVCPNSFPDLDDLQSYVFTNGTTVESFNQVCLPFNIILTESEQFAKAYLNTGTVPPDAILYPIDWNNLPSYTPSDDDGGDGDDDNDPDDNSRDITPNLPDVPTFTPSMLSNYNVYWLTVPQLSDFISWFWNDISGYSSIEDLLNKIQGLYNDLASAIMFIRYMPVSVNAYEFGGLGTDSNIIVGMVEKSGAVNTISKTNQAPIIDIGHIEIPNKYKSFVDLAPYSEVMLYLPYHGFVDLDIDILSGHELYVKAIYDYMSGTVQYLLYVDNQFLINSYVVKLAVDIPLTLQTKNDRDTAIFQNVSNAVSGLIGASASIGQGNPIGFALSVGNVINSGTASAPINVKGNVGEQGAFYAPQQCAIVIRRPTIANHGDMWQKTIGQMCAKAYTLRNLEGKGFTMCHNPVISFSGNSYTEDGNTVKMMPLDAEITEIYDYLTKGVIL